MDKQKTPGTRLPEMLQKNESRLLDEWVRIQLSTASRKDRLSENQLREHSREFLEALRQGTQNGDPADINTQAWAPMRDVLSNVSRQRAMDGFTPSETAIFIFSLKEPLFSLLRQQYADQPSVLTDEIWAATQLLDKLGLQTTEVFQKTRDEIILRQQQEMLELSTPVVQLWPGILALPIIGTLDSARTQVIMQSLLETIVSTGSALAILDITGVPTVDTQVAQHLLKTVAAAQLMGAECIISGVRPQIAQTVVHLGVDLSNVTTKANLAGALRVAFQKLGLAVVRHNGQPPMGHT